MSDVLAKLEADLAIQEAAVANAQAAAHQLKVAIAAIKRDMEASARAVAGQRSGTKRGVLSDAILGCIQRNIGTVATIDAELRRVGIESTRQSISNAIQRMQRKGIVRAATVTGEWRLANKTAPPEGEAVNDSGGGEAHH